MRQILVLALVVTTLLGCTDDPEDGADDVDAAAMITNVIDLMRSERFGDIAPLTDERQAKLLLLLEGVPPDDLIPRLDEPDEQVAANFWEGFAEVSTGALSDGATVTAEGGIDIGSEPGQAVTITLDDGRQRRWVVKTSGERAVVDLFASFASSFAGTLIEPVDRLLSDESEDGRRLLAALVTEIDSLEVAANDPNITTTEQQEIITLIERISRAQG